MAFPAEWCTLLNRPQAENAWQTWFDRLAAYLLNGCRLMVNGRPHRLIEVEVYYHGPGHADPFAHCDPLQRENGRWYFHRTKGVYRGGSFKGVDLTFGDGTAYGGVLFRGLETPKGEIVDGPSLLVDTLLATTGAATIAELDRAIAERSVWDSDGLLRLQSLPATQQHAMIQTARVGLTLKRATANDERDRYLLRRYRYLSEPRQTAKGKPLMVLAGLQDGLTPEAIRDLTGCPLATVRRYQADFEAGRAETDLTPYLGRDLSTADLCRLHGREAARAKGGTESPG
jgi:hypothetical protein